MFMRTMLKGYRSAAAFIFLFVVASPLCSKAETLVAGYIGAEKCAACHKGEYDGWQKSGHALILRKPTDSTANGIPLPSGFSQNDISYVIGGHRWKVLFLDKKGYLITSTPAGKGKNQYNLNSKKWVDYLPGQKTPYDCGGCHTTGYSPHGHQNGLEGIVGTWQFEGVQCEGCHGPGAAHAASTKKSDIKIIKTVCVGCHGIKSLDLIQLKGVFLEPYTEENQLLKSRMKNLLCTVCHNPHLDAEKSIKQNCESCHRKASERYRESYMFQKGIICTDCHMPPAGIVATGDPKIFRGDLKSHIFAIDPRKDFPSMTVHGETVNPGYLSVDYACTPCHNIFENRQWAVSFGAVSHRIKITTNIKIMRLQMSLALLGFLSSLVALSSAFSLKQWILPSLNKKGILSIHKHAAWITFALYVFISIICIYFHFPLSAPEKVLEMGWFLIHPINGALGLIIYSGKIVAVRKFKKGWATPGLTWGIGLSVFWLVQYATAIFSFLGR